jgi:nicotinate-nucleotide adenylyltransferase
LQDLRANEKIAILGGSFDLAHPGHCFISKQAKQILGLDKVLWLPAYRHPFKPQQSDFATRYRSAVELAKPHWIKVSDLEQKHKTQNSFEALSLLLRYYPQARFVLLMGADVFCQLHTWHRYQELLHLMPIAIQPRQNARARFSPVADQWARAILPAHKLRDLPYCATPPAFGFLPGPQFNLSSSQMREK